jgi:hypothetical protein
VTDEGGSAAVLTFSITVNADDIAEGNEIIKLVGMIGLG